MADKIKKLSKNGNEYPIGSDARLIDTFSNVDLESLIKIGESHYTTIRYTETGEVTELFFSLDIAYEKDLTIISDIQCNLPYYRLETTFNTLQDINIGALSDDLAIVVGNGDPHQDDPSQDTYLVDRTEVETTYEHIIKRLYYKANSDSDEVFIVRKDIYKIPQDNNLYNTLEELSFNE